MALLREIRDWLKMLGCTFGRHTYRPVFRTGGEGDPPEGTAGWLCDYCDHFRKADEYV